MYVKPLEEGKCTISILKVEVINTTVIGLVGVGNSTIKSFEKDLRREEYLT